MPAEDQQPGIPLYHGLSPRQRLTIALSSVVLAALVMGFFANQSDTLSKKLGFEASELNHIEQLAHVDSADIATYAIQSQAHIKILTNQHALSMLGVGAGLALFIVGFALSLIGADGSFQIRGKVAGTPNPDQGGVSASGTAPGILCFICGTVIIVIGISRTYKVSFTGAEIDAIPEDTASSLGQAARQVPQP